MYLNKVFICAIILTYLVCSAGSEQRLRMRFYFRNETLADTSGLDRDAVIQHGSNVTFAEGRAPNCPSGRSVEFTGEVGSHLQMPEGAVNDWRRQGALLSFYFFVHENITFDSWFTCRAMWIVRQQNTSTATDLRMCLAKNNVVYLFQKGVWVFVGQSSGGNVRRGAWNWIALQRITYRNRYVRWFFYLNRIYTVFIGKWSIIDFHKVPEGGHLMGGDSMTNGYHGLMGRIANINFYTHWVLFTTPTLTRFLYTPACYGDSDLLFHYPLNNTQNNVTDISPNMRGEAPIGPNVSLALVHNGQLSCVYFDGSEGSYIRLPSHEVRGLTEFTIAFWVKVGNMTRDQDIVSLLTRSRIGYGTFDYEISVRIEDGQVVSSVFSHFIRRGDGRHKYPKVVMPEEHFNETTFNHITVALKGSTLSMYVNGSHSVSTTFHMVFPMSFGYEDTFLLGQRARNHLGHLHEDFPFEGYITDMRMYQVGINVTSDLTFQETITQQPPLIPLPPPAPERQSDAITEQAWFAPLVTGVVVTAMILATAALVIFRRRRKTQRMGTILDPSVIDQSTIINGSLAKGSELQTKKSQWSELSRVELERIDQVFFPTAGAK